MELREIPDARLLLLGQYCQTRVFEGIGFFDLKGTLIPIPRTRDRLPIPVASLSYAIHVHRVSNLPLKNRRYPAITFSGYRKSETGDRGKQWTRHSFFVRYRQQGCIQTDIRPRLAPQCEIPSRDVCKIGKSV